MLILPDYKVQELWMMVGDGGQDPEYKDVDNKLELEKTISMEGSGFLKKWNKTTERKQKNVMNKPNEDIEHSSNQFISYEHEESEAISSSTWQTYADDCGYDNKADIVRSVTGDKTIPAPPSIQFSGPLSVLVQNPPPPPAHLFPAFLKGPLSVLAKSDVTWMLRRILHVFHPGSFGKGRNIWSNVVIQVIYIYDL